MVTAQEITVALNSTGTGEVASDINNVEQEFGETAQTVGDSAAEMQGFSTEFAGAMTAIVGGLAVAAAGLLAQVPVVGGLMESLAAVVGAIAFQMDKVLRPVLQPLSKAFFAVSNAIFEAEGPLGTLIGVISSVVSIAAVVLGTVLSVVGVLSQLGLTSLTVGGVLSTLASAIGTVVTAIVAAVSWPAVLAAALLGLAFVFRDEIANAIGVALDWLGDFVSSLGESVGDIWDALADIAAGFADWASDLISDALEWGKDIIDNIIQGIKNGVGALRNILSDISGGTVNIGSGGGGGGGSSMSTTYGPTTGNASGASVIDGRRLDESTGRYGKDRSTRRGAGL